MPAVTRRRALGLALFSVFALAPSTRASRGASRRSGPAPGGGPPGGGGNGQGGGKGGGKKRGTIVGEVLGTSGPIGGATVLLFDAFSIDQIAETVTDPQGNFQLGRLREGSYSMTAISLNPPCSGSTSVNLVAGQKISVIIACQ